MIAAAISYWIKKTFHNTGQISICCSKCTCRRTNRARAEPLYDIPYYYAAPPLPPRNEITIVECDTKLDDCEILENNGNQDESSQQHCDPITDEIFHNPSTSTPNLQIEENSVMICTASVHLDDFEAKSYEARDPEMQQNSSYCPSTNISNIAANPAYGTDIAIAPEILTEQNEAYVPRTMI